MSLSSELSNMACSKKTFANMLLIYSFIVLLLNCYIVLLEQFNNVAI